MVSDISLEESLTYFKKKKGTNTRNLHHALTTLGFECPSRLMRVKKNHPLPNLCIVNVRWYDKHGKRLNMGHWCLYHDGKFYDPESGIYAPDDFDRMITMWKGKITSYLPIDEKES